MAALAAGELEEALRELSRAHRLQPDLAEAHLAMGKALLKYGKVEAARLAYRNALDLDPNSDEAKSMLATLPPPPLRPDFEKGQELRALTSASYRVREVMQGGFGTVYIVEWKGVDGLFVLKSFQARYLWSDGDRARFDREAVTWVLLGRHPNLVHAVALDDIEEIPCLVLEHMAGGDLAKRLEDGPLAPEEAIPLALQLCDGLGYAQEVQGIVHLDVNPRNCLLSESGEVLKVTDLGLARAFGGALEGWLEIGDLGLEAIAEYTSPLGSVPYLAPEQLDPSATLDTRTDIYAFGIVLHEMLTGFRPRQGTLAQAQIVASGSDGALPADLRELVLRCVDPDAAVRPQRFSDVRRELEATHLELTGRAAAPPPEPLPLEPQDWFRRGATLGMVGRFSEALSCYERVGEVERTSLYWIGRGAALVGLRRYDDAIEHYYQGVEAEPWNWVLWANLAEPLAEVGEVEEALAACEQAVRLAPNLSGVWLNLGTALQRQKPPRREEAAHAYRRGLEHNRRDSRLWANLGRVLTKLRQFGDALNAFEQGLAIAPRSLELWDAKGLWHGALGEHEKALRCFERALEISRAHSRLWRNKGFSLYCLECYEEAAEAYTEALKLATDDPTLWMDKGTSLAKLALYEEALGAYGRGLDLAPRDRRLLESKAKTLRCLGRDNEAEAILRQLRSRER